MRLKNKFLDCEGRSLIERKPSQGEFKTAGSVKSNGKCTNAWEKPLGNKRRLGLPPKEKYNPRE